MKKRLFCLLLTVLLLCGSVPAASAAVANGRDIIAAECLYALDLFKGTGTNPDGTPIFALDQTPTRNQAIIMLVRLLGKEDEALAGTWDIPFTDVSDTMRPYVGYAYANGLTNGYTATTYCGSNPIKATQYIVFVLRALGYEDGVDFQWDTAWQLATELRINDENYSAASKLTRGDVALLSRNALQKTLKDSDTHLVELVCDKPVAPDIPVTADSFCFFYPYPQHESSDIITNTSTHGYGPRDDRQYTLIVNGSIVRDDYTVTCRTPGFCEIRMLRDGRFEVEALRPGTETIYVTYGDVTAQFKFFCWRA